MRGFERTREGFCCAEGTLLTQRNGSETAPTTGASFNDFEHAGPGTLAGRYLRRFWQPIAHSQDVAPQQAKPLRIMSEDFTLYRGEGGTVHLLDSRCAHRGTQLSTGWVEGDCIRCFYHGWKYGGSGQCVEQPAEDASFAQKVKIKSHPVQEYLGLIFAYLGDAQRGDTGAFRAPPLPRYPEFEDPASLLEPDTFRRRCNYFQNVENALDTTHVGFVHRGLGDAFNGEVDTPRVWGEESTWGITYYAQRPSGPLRVQQFGMPNVFHMYRLRPDPEIAWAENLFWWVPIDDESHWMFGVSRIPVEGEARERYQARREARLARRDLVHHELAEELLAGRLRLADVDPTCVDLVRLQDDVAQVGQGRIADRSRERLGRGDVGVIMIRKLWARELQALAEGRPPTQWVRSDDLVLMAGR
jgi:5,5'-dehydrodivanillate O-demethylase